MTAAALVATTSAALPASADAAGGPVTHKQNDRVPEGAAWTQHYFPSSDGSKVELHADVLLPENLPKGQKVPVILSVGAYFGHSGQMDVEGFKKTGPSARFNDLIEGAGLFKRGYALVLVDVRGFGGSTGCLDFVGPGEQADVKAAIDWAAKQPWSTGAVGMYGKSFDAITGLVGNNLNQDALKAVVAMEPMWDPYRNFSSGGVPRTTRVNVSNTYNKIATLPQLPDDDPRYLANAKYEQKHPECAATNMFGYQTGDPQAAYWKTRDLAERAKGSDTPLFVTQGFLEWNTEAEAMEEYLGNHKGPQRAWLGPWDHKRGNDRTADGRLEMGREGWFEETMSFFDQYLKGVKPTTDYPAVSIQDSTGKWRAQDTWPVTDRSAAIRLGGGSYLDDGAEEKVTDKNTFVKWSKPLTQATRVTGTPRLSFDSEQHGNVMVKLYDVAPDGTAVMFDEQVSLVDAGRTELELKSTDWTLAKGHSLAVEIGTVQPAGDWLDTPTRNTIKVTDARLDLDLDDPADDTATEGERAPYLDTYLKSWTKKLRPGSPAFTLPAVKS
ncbi:CocE/NonD family hydrolase [Nonomuraea sp. NPDC050404]|uniref:CocE/NonD family hydrolase n=1 Tax=Nonomuraea sp. NPDC050404 TaxID=3155783 RepID=UPI0033E7221D